MGLGMQGATAINDHNTKTLLLCSYYQYSSKCQKILESDLSLKSFSQILLFLLYSIKYMTIPEY